jgi:hypothetical protein
VPAGVGDPDEGWHWHYSKRGWRMDRSAWAPESGTLLYVLYISLDLIFGDSFPHVISHESTTLGLIKCHRSPYLGGSFARTRLELWNLLSSHRGTTFIFKSKMRERGPCFKEFHGFVVPLGRTFAKPRCNFTFLFLRNTIHTRTHIIFTCTSKDEMVLVMILIKNRT